MCVFVGGGDYTKEATAKAMLSESGPVNCLMCALW